MNEFDAEWMKHDIILCAKYELWMNELWLYYETIMNCEWMNYDYIGIYILQMMVKIEKIDLFDDAFTWKYAIELSKILFQIGTSSFLARILVALALMAKPFGLLSI